MQNDNVIIWQKWIDPFGRDENPEQEEFGNFVEDDAGVEEDPKDESFLAGHSIKYGVKVIATPMGVIPVNDNTASGKLFNFWMGHTNFDITEKIAGLIEKIDGVEALDIFTRYRFRIGIGKAFNDSAVMRNITNKVYKYLAKT
jgi:hypothetical protein